MSLLYSCFRQVKDPRRAQAKQYELVHLLLYSVLGIASGATSYRRIHQFMDTHWLRLNEAFGSTWRKAPAYTSIRYCLHGLSSDEIEKALRCYARALRESIATEQETQSANPSDVRTRHVIALDGKTLRGSLDHFADRKAAQVLNAFLVEEQLVLGQIVFEDQYKDHEIPAAQRLINELGLSGVLYTLDALHCQKKP